MEIPYLLKVYKGFLQIFWGLQHPQKIKPKSIPFFHGGKQFKFNHLTSQGVGLIYASNRQGKKVQEWDDFYC